MIPPIAPSITANRGEGANGSAVMATSPPRAPFSIITTSVFPDTSLEIIAHAITPAQAARFVLIKIVATAVESSNVPNASCEPPLKPNHPIHNINTPRVASGIDELAKGSIVAGSPDSLNRPRRGPSNNAPAKAAAAPALCTSVEPAKSEKPAAARCPPPHCQPISIG